jgi:CRISPR-associated protein Cas1
MTDAIHSNTLVRFGIAHEPFDGERMTDAIHSNTLYVLTQGAYLHRDHLTLQVEIERQVKLSVPIHNVESVVVFGNVMVSPGSMALCAENGVALSFMSEHGRLLSRVDAPVSGNVLLRREQYRKADDAGFACALARHIVAAKIQNCRNSVMRAAREAAAPANAAVLNEAAEKMGKGIRQVADAASVDSARGFEGEAAHTYFSVFSLMIKQQAEHFKITARTRRPPLDATNALLSFSYALLAHDCTSALYAAGLDPNVGYLHVDRPGRPSLALDLMEEFRPLFADRLVLTLINRKEVQPDDFVIREGGAVEMSEKARRTLVKAYQSRKEEEIMHPVLEQQLRFGMLPFIQARLLARHVRGDLPAYPPVVLK